MNKNKKCIACLDGNAYEASLCPKCREQYGRYVTWPAWLKFLQWDTTRVRTDSLSMSVERPFTQVDEESYFDKQTGRVVHSKRQSLLDQYDERGYPVLRGCRDFTFALINGKEPDYA